MGRLVDTDILVKIIDKHTNDDSQLDNDITCILEEVPTAYDVEKAEKERKALQKRCRIFTNGVMCMNCSMECEDRTMPFFGKKVE